MRGYPKHINTKVDFENLLTMPEFKDRALKDLKAIRDLADDKVKEVVSMEADAKSGEEKAVTKEIDNPLPAYKLKGFKDRQEVTALISAVEKKEVR